MFRVRLESELRVQLVPKQIVGMKLDTLKFFWFSLTPCRENSRGKATQWNLKVAMFGPREFMRMNLGKTEILKIGATLVRLYFKMSGADSP